MLQKVEFLGLPCSGKSFELNKQFELNDIGFADQQPLHKRVLGCFFQIVFNPFLFACVLKTFLFVPINESKLHLIGVFRFYSRLHDVRFKQKDLLALEEGVLQALWGLLMYMNVSLESKKIGLKILAKTVVSQRKIIYISCPKEILYARNLARIKKTRFSQELLKCDEGKVQQLRFWMAFILIESKKNNSIILKNSSGNTTHE